MPKLYVFCGIPGSGKTYLSEQLLEEHNTATLFCFDKIIKTHNKNAMKARYIMYADIKAKLHNGEDVIVDNTYITEKSRINLLSYIRDIECEKNLIVVQAPIDICIERNNSRETHNVPEFTIHKLHDEYEKPSLSEGWDDIKFIENN